MGNLTESNTTLEVIRTTLANFLPNSSDSENFERVNRLGKKKVSDNKENKNLTIYEKRVKEMSLKNRHRKRLGTVFFLNFFFYF